MRQTTILHGWPVAVHGDATNRWAITDRSEYSHLQEYLGSAVLHHLIIVSLTIDTNNCVTRPDSLRSLGCAIEANLVPGSQASILQDALHHQSLVTIPTRSEIDAETNIICKSKAEAEAVATLKEGGLLSTRQGLESVGEISC